MRDTVDRFVSGSRFQTTIIALIIINAVILGLETSDSVMADYGTLMKTIDRVILWIFVVELALRLYVQRLKFFTNPWAMFDTAVVAIAFAPASEAFAALRALRVLRVLRLISVVPTMRKVIEGLLGAIPGIASVALLMALIFYVFSVIATHLFNDSFPEWFGTMGATMYTLFQVMTLESWSMGIVRPVMDVYPWAWLFFVTYILVTTFTMLNLFIAIIVNSMHSDSDQEAEASRVEMKDSLTQELKDMEARLMAEIQRQSQQSIDARRD